MTDTDYRQQVKDRITDVLFQKLEDVFPKNKSSANVKETLDEISDILIDEILAPVEATGIEQGRAAGRAQKTQEIQALIPSLIKQLATLGE